MRLSLAALLPLLSLVGFSGARSSTGDRVLVVLEPQIAEADYSKFWASLKERGYQLTFRGPKDESAQLVKFGEPQYDHLIMFAPSAKSFAAPLSPKSVIEAQFRGLNTLYLLSSNISEINRDTFREYDLEFAERDSTLLDAFSHPPGSSVSTVLLPPPSTLVPNHAILSPSTLSAGPIVYPSGTVHTIGLNPYLVEVLHSSKTAYVGEERVLDADEAEVEAATSGKGEKEAVWTGKKAALVSAMQTRDNVRIGFVGSGAMLRDDYWGMSVDGPDGRSHQTSNAEFATDFIKWIFQETGVVKIISSTHHREGEVSPRELYRIKDDLTYSLTLAAHYTMPNGTSYWGPWHAEDLQMDFTMLDPHIRTALTEDKSIISEIGTTYTAKFRAPDRHGVFKFVVEYWRPGWSYIRSSSTASVVPFRHDEYPRFITGAWPFYTACISMSFAFLLFCAMWVASTEDRGTRTKNKAE